MKVGDYVRTKEGLIAKITSLDNKSVYSEIIIDTDKKENITCSYQEDLKSSPNIIDLIEVGDYINGYKVIKINYHLFGYKVKSLEIDSYKTLIRTIDPGEIKSIVTKEQFSQMEYKNEE